MSGCCGRMGVERRPNPMAGFITPGSPRTARATSLPEAPVVHERPLVPPPSAPPAAKAIRATMEVAGDMCQCGARIVPRLTVASGRYVQIRVCLGCGRRS